MKKSGISSNISISKVAPETLFQTSGIRFSNNKGRRLTNVNPVSELPSSDQKTENMNGAESRVKAKEDMLNVAVNLETEEERKGQKEDERKNTAAAEEAGKTKRGKLMSWAEIVREHRFRSQEFSETVSMQGLGPICDPGSSVKRRLSWFAIVAVAVAFTAFNIHTQITMYVRTPISVRVDFRKAQTLDFPTVTVCNNNFYSYATAANHSAVEIIKQMQPLPFGDKANMVPDFAAYDYSYYTQVGWDVYYRLFTQNFSAMLLRCQWEQEVCSMDNFTSVYTDMGLCYSFNANGAIQTRDAGRSYGLKLTLDAKQHDYLGSIDDYFGAGFRVMVHASSVPAIMAERGVAVSPGQHNFLAVDVKKLKNAKPSISQCGSLDLKYYPAGYYSSEACRLECRTDAIYAACGCRNMYMPNTHIRICDPPEFYICYLPTEKAYRQHSHSCADECPEPCEEYLYNVLASSNPLGNNFLAEFATIQGKNASYWEDNLVHLEIYLTSMTFEKVEKQPSYTLLELFCDVGGAFGLLLGASMLTLLEIVDFFLCRLSPSSSSAAAASQVLPVRPGISAVSPRRH